MRDAEMCEGCLVDSGGGPTYTPLRSAQALVRKGGAAALFRGWIPLWARFLPSSVLTFVIYEQSRKILLGKYLE